MTTYTLIWQLEKNFGGKIRWGKGKKRPTEQTLPQVWKIIAASRHPENVRRLARRFFWVLGKAEAKVHRTSPRKVRLHEVGRMGNVYRALGIAAFLKKKRIRLTGCTPVNLGSGKVKSAHGWLQVPTPATRELLRRFRVFRRGRGELTTPSGAAWIRLLCRKG